MAVSIETFNEKLGKLVRKIIADTPANDVRRGSVLATLLEAVAEADFENSAAVLSVLEALSIDALKNADLDARATTYGLTRTTAVRATGFAKFLDSNITKRATTLYAVKNPPIASATTIYVNDASDWDQLGGSLYIGRGTQQFEGPIAYSSIDDFGSYFRINLASALQKDHLLSDSVVDAQGTTDRVIGAGTIVKIPSNNQTPEIRFSTLRNAVIPAGEDSVTDIAIVASQVGTQGNAGIGAITAFDTAPFSGATVTNTGAVTTGRDVETDDELRDRLKTYANTLARGTRASILASLVGLSDQDDGKQISSASMTEPTNVGNPSLVYVDDGSGFQPSYAGQGVDVLLNSATGREEFLQLSNYPLPRPQVVNQVDGPYELVDGSVFRVAVDEVEEEITFNAEDFNNIAAATLPEIVVVINENAQLFRCRLTENSSRILLYPVAHDAEYIQVSEQSESEESYQYANSVLKFPTNKYSYIVLYKNNTLLSEKARSALIRTVSFDTWNITASGNLILSVDGTPEQDRSFSTLDFDSRPLNSISAEEWVEVFNQKFAGISASLDSANKVNFASNKIGAESAISALGGSYLGILFPNQSIADAGTNSDFQLNRQTGNLRMLVDVESSDSVSAGIEDAKGSVVSDTTLGAYSLNTDASGRPAEAVISTDSDAARRTGVAPAEGNALTITNTSSTMRVMANNTMFAKAQIGDYIYIANRGDTLGSGAWVGLSSCGLYRIKAKGAHLVPSTDTYVEVDNVSAVVGGPYAFVDPADMGVLESSAYPQIWKGTFLPTPASASLQEVADSINDNLVNIRGTIYKTNSIKSTSTTENNGSIATPVAVGNAVKIFDDATDSQFGNQSHVATKITGRDLVSSFRRTAPTPTNVWLGRYSYRDVRDALDADASPSNITYGEQLQAAGTFTTSTMSADDLLVVESGSNEMQIRDVKEFFSTDQVRTQIETPTTLMDFIVGDELSVARSLTLSADDSVVFVLDGDEVNKTINVNMWRTGRVNSGYAPSPTAFSADDADNESGINFGTLATWSKTTFGTEFKNYAVWFRSHNWYASGGSGSGNATMIVRTNEYGPNGDRHRFAMEYPSLPDQSFALQYDSNPNYALTTYIYSSGPERTTGIGTLGNNTFKVVSLGGNYWQYNFQGAGVDLSTVVAGDVLSLPDSSGISAANSGQFSVYYVDVMNKFLQIYNPNGTPTLVGTPEVTSVVCTQAGRKAQISITCTAEGAGGSLVGNGDYFELYDDGGKVVFWYDVNNSGFAEPTVSGASRYVEITTVNTGDSAITVASKTAAVINADSKFSATSVSATVNVTNSFYGSVTLGVSSGNGFALGFTTTGITGLPGGSYFVLEDQNGTVAVWFDIDGESEPPHGADRSIQVSTIAQGDSANTVASALNSVINADAEYSSSVATNTVTITDVTNGVRADAIDGSTPYATSLSITTTTQGVDDGVEDVINQQGCRIFPLAANTCQEVCDAVTTSYTLNAVPVGNTGLLFKYSTREEVYSYSGNSSALAYNHDPDPTDPSGRNHAFISLYDGYSYVKTFENSNPHFVLKKALTIPGSGVFASTYAMDTCPNPGTTDLGEFFKLIPKTVKNVNHHLSHKALSQLPIVADVDIAGNYRRAQIKSKLFGTAGSVEVVGGRANLGEFSLVDDAITTTADSIDYLDLKVSAYPSTLNAEDPVEVYNTKPAKRLSRLTEDDSIDVELGTSGSSFYLYNPREIYSSPWTSWTIADTSGTYGRSAGTVWRWTHNDAGSKFKITGDAVGSVAAAPADYSAAGVSDASALEVFEYANGTVSTPVEFSLSVSSLPTQADYFAFRSTAGVTFAVWFDINNAGALPTGGATPYGTATYQIEVDILSTDTPDQVTAKLAATLSANTNFNTSFSGIQIPGTSLASAVPGDLINIYGNSWSAKNQSQATGLGEISGYPIIAVDAANKYVDVVNPNGVSMSSALLGTNGTLTICPAPAIRWRLKHSALVKGTIVVSGGTATFTCDEPHRLQVGSSASISDTGNVTLDATQTIATTPNVKTFTFTTGATAGTYYGSAIESGRVRSQYRVEKMHYNNLIKLRRSAGDSPYFADCGVAVDDFVVLSGSTFQSLNNGRFRVLAVDNDYLVLENPSAVGELRSYKNFNEKYDLADSAVVWTANSTTVTAISNGRFKNVSVGDWVKKVEDDEEMFVQVSVVGATTLTLAAPYIGTTGSAKGIAYNQASGALNGVTLQSVNDIVAYEGDSVWAKDSLVIETVADPLWFNSANSGVKLIEAFGSDEGDRRPYVKITNYSAVAEAGRSLSVADTGLYILEGENSLYRSRRQVNFTALNNTNTNVRDVYVTPADRSYKLSPAYGSKVISLGKLSFDVGVTTGIDGYTYYTGLMRTAQRTVDGYEPDRTRFPGLRAVGSAIEILPPLIRQIELNLNVTTKNGINLTDINNDIKSSIISYVDSLEVGGDVILSEIVSRIMNISGVEAVTLTSPLPSVERIAVDDDQKAFITPDLIKLF